MKRTKAAASPRTLLWLVAIGFFMQTLDGTIVNTALPSMARSLGESPLRMQAVVVSYMLTMAALIPASGWLADRFGTRNIYCLAVLLFTAGSGACALASNLSELVLARILQGTGGALLLPVGRLTVMQHFPRDRFLPAMSFIAIPGLIGPLIGPALGGWLVEIASWHWIFLINLPVGLVGILATLWVMPNQRLASVPQFDIAGYLLLVAAMVSISLALDSPGWAHMMVAMLMVLGLAALSGYCLHALHHPAPLFSPRLFRVASFRVGLLGNIFARIGTGAIPYLMPLLLQLVMDFSPAEAGMLLLPVTLASMAAKKAVTTIVRQYGYRRVLIINTVLLGLMVASFALMTPEQPLWLRCLQLAAFGAISSTQFSAMNTVTLKDLNTEQAASGNSLFSMVQMLGMSLGITCASALLHAFSAWLGVEDGHASPDAFRAAFVAIGIITIAASGIFTLLRPDTPRPGRRRHHLEGPPTSEQMPQD